MGNIGRMLCVALPFILTVASVISLLVACLAGVTDKSLYLFKINTTDLSISSSSISSLLSERGLVDPTLTVRDDSSSLLDSATSAIESATGTSDAASAVESAISGGGSNITAADLGLADAYYVSIWNYCEESSSGNKTCKKARFDWAANATNSFQDKLDTVASSLGTNITLPDSIKTAMNTFSTVSRWTEIVFVIAFIALAAELLFGIFANCSRAFSCCTTIIGMFATVAVIAAASLATAMAAVVVGVVEGTASDYGVSGSINKHFLAAVWIAAAFAIGAGFFWVFTCCCCAPDHRSSRRSGGSPFNRSKEVDNESMMSAGGANGYQHLNNQNQPTGYNNGTYGGFGNNNRSHNADVSQEGYTHAGTNRQYYG